MTENLRLLLKKFADFSEEELDYIVSYFKPRFVKKNTIILHEGSVCKEFYFIQSGCMRTFFIDKNGHEKTRYVVVDYQVGTVLKSFITQKSSIEFIETLDDTELLSMSHENFYRLNDEINHWRIFYQKILERAYSFQNRKIESLVTLTAQQRYEQLVKENPVLIQKLSNKVLASYLDMREETLSRLKSK